MHCLNKVLVTALCLAYTIQAQSTYFCSTKNTGTGFSSVYAQFQSKGACSGTCAGYSFAIAQGFQCWCSNYFPADRASSSLCNTPCPGYDIDNCGGTLNGAFAYYQLAQASGTQAVSSSAPATPTTARTSTTTAAPSTTPSTQSTTSTTATPVQPVTIVVTQTPSSQQPATPATSATETSTSPSSSSSRTSSSTTRSSTASGSKASSTQEALQSQTKNGFFDSPGKVAGTFVAVGLVAAGLIAAALFLCFRRRNHRRSESAMAVAGLNRKTSSTSTMENISAVSHDARSRSGSASGLMGSGREKGAGNISPAGTNWPINDSGIVPVDQRLNPRPILMRFDSNYSRHSLRDEEDYSRRVLTVVNPEGRG